MVSVHFTLKDEAGEVLEQSEADDPLTFEVGAGELMGNPLFQGFDAAIRGLQEGDVRSFQCKAGERQEDLIFSVPTEHEEIQRLESEMGAPLQPGFAVVLANGELATIVAREEKVVCIDTNPPLAGKALSFEVRLATIEKQPSR